MAGTLALLGDAGYELHIMTVANGSCGTIQYSRADTIAMRREEAAQAAACIGATYHPGLVDDLEVLYELPTLRRLSAVIREVAPAIVLTHSPVDYMEDHVNTCRLVVTACFARGMPNFATEPGVPPFEGDIYLYHAQPHGNRDPLRQPVKPELFVDVTSKVRVKESMLRRHVSQKHWLDTSQGMDSYLVAMRDLCAEVASWAPGGGMEYAEGMRRHLHLGFSPADDDPLSAALGDHVTANPDYFAVS